MAFSDVQKPSPEAAIDLLIIGGGVNGCGIARDAAGRGLKVTLCEMDDLAGATSSASTKLFHGGLRYLEYFEVGLVRKALKEREILLQMMPHISWPMRFILPYHKDMRFETETSVSNLLKYIMPWMKGRRPAWLIRLGLFVYDHLGARKILPATKTLNLASDIGGEALQNKFVKAFEYSDCWVQDSRLVVLNARDAERCGATIKTRTKVVNATRKENNWRVELESTKDGTRNVIYAKAIVNASGPWVADVIENITQNVAREGVRLVRGSHIVIKKIFNHDKAYFLQGTDGRIIFAIPYEEDFTLIGTTDQDYEGKLGKATCTDEEAQYLCDFASDYFEQAIRPKDIIWSYSGVRPLYEDGAKSATAATRDYVLSLNTGENNDQPPVLNIFGGKITTYRRLAENALEELTPFFENLSANWTSGTSLPGGDFEVDAVDQLIKQACIDYEFLELKAAKRLIRCYGTELSKIYKHASKVEDLGIDFGAGLSQAEVEWLISHEYAQTAEDILWRRTKLGLKMNKTQVKILQNWISNCLSEQSNAELTPPVKPISANK